MTKNVLEMSDEELMKLTDSEIEALANAPAPVDHEGDQAGLEGDPEPGQVNDQATEPAQEEDKSETSGDEEPGQVDNEQKPDEQAPGDVEDAPDTTEDKPAEDEPVQERDYKSEVSRILAPIKANGRSIQVDTVDDAIQLMQMGANYHKKMEGLKPNLATLKLLEKEGLLDQDKLSHLIDLARGDTGAINKLIKDKNIDLLTLDGENAKDYKVSAYNVNLKEVDLDNVLEELKESPHYSNLLDTVGNKWDSASQKTIADNPEILKAINAHMESGIFDKIQERMHTEKALGRLQGVSAIEAYRTIGDRMQAEGKFNSTPATSAQTKVAAVKPVPAKPSVDATKERKLAASGTKGATSTKTEPTYDPLSMSDEDFEKLYKTQFNTR